MGSPGTAIPKRNTSVDPRTLPIGALEGFLLSCIDGKASLGDLEDLSGMSRAQVEAAIARLVELGAIVFEQPASPASSPTVTARVPHPPSGLRVPTETYARRSAETTLDEAVDLGPERRKQVLDTYASLERIDYYGLLGIPDTADKNEVRNAYFALSKLFHPDTMYGKQLGSYKAKMEAIFKNATEAYETLSRRKRREEYDESRGLPPLEARLETARRAAASPGAASPASPASEGHAASSSAAPRSEAARISSVRPRPADERAMSGEEARFPRPSGLSRPRDSSPGEPRPATGGSSPGEARPATGGSSPGEPRPLGPAPRSGTSGALPSEPARQRAQQRILQQIAQMTTGRQATPIPPPRAATPAPPAAAAPHGERRQRDSILRGLAGSLRDAGRITGTDRVDVQLRTAAVAEQSGDLLGASNLLRALRDAAPDREDVAEAYGRVRLALAKAQAEGYEKQAIREEKMEMWGAAAISWSRVAEGRPDSSVAHRRAAHCIFMSNGDMKRARDLAQRAVELDPRNSAARVTLGRVYLAAGMKLNARRELEVAAKLDPKDEFVKNLLREMKS